MGTPAQPDLIENVGKINPPHCGHIRPPLLGMLVGGVGSGRGLRQRTDRRHDFCRHGAIRYLHWSKRINVPRLLRAAWRGVLHGMSGKLVRGELVT